MGLALEPAGLVPAQERVDQVDVLEPDIRPIALPRRHLEQPIGILVVAALQFVTFVPGALAKFEELVEGGHRPHPASSFRTAETGTF